MRAKRLELLLLFVLLVTWAGVEFLRPVAGNVVEQVAVVETARAFPDTAPVAVPVLPSPTPEHVTVPEAAVEVSTPVQSVEERRDAMLFESEALFGTPFDHAAVMPFD